jgi:hypothetical protein
MEHNSSDNEDNSAEEDEYFSLNKDSESSITSDCADNQYAVSAKKHKKIKLEINQAEQEVKC